MKQKAQQKFLEEGLGLIADLEEAVLALENNPSDAQSIEEVFRVMHTFKGTAKMFGFDTIGAFTHNLETIYDQVRSGQKVVEEEVLEITLQSIDLLRALLTQPEGNNESVNDQLNDLTFQLENLSQPNSSDTTSANAKSSSGLYLIKFEPYREFLFSGNNPTYLIEDVCKLGPHYVHVNGANLPDMEDFNAEATYLKWDIVLFTESNEEEIREEFIFAESECDLQIHLINRKNLLATAPFKKKLEEAGEDIQPEYLKPTITDNNTEVKHVTQTQQTIKVTYSKIDNMMNLISELVTTQARLSLFNEQSGNGELDEITENIEKLTRMLRDEAFSISLIPISYLKVRFERLVRDTAKMLNKQVRFVTVGEDTELDKKIIENLTDPILHLLRNAMDHGIESPSERVKKGKNETGTIKMNAYYSGANVIVEISDDGAGLNLKRIKAKAVDKNLISPEDILSDKQLMELIFHPGFSTSEQVTDVSGRGVGMDVVVKAIKALRGEIQIRSKEGEGTRFIIKLPLSLSIIDGLLVNVATDKYVIPLPAIQKCYEIKSTTLMHNMNDIIVLDNQQIPFINLRELFAASEAAPEWIQLIVVKYKEQLVALAVDGIIDEYQAVLKPLGHTYSDQDFISGGTILGDGSIALVLDPNRLVERIPQLIEN